MRDLARTFIVAGVVAVISAGCQTYKTQTSNTTGAWERGNATAAAEQFGAQADQKDNSRDSVIWHLEAGAAHRAAGNYRESDRHLAAAAVRMDDYEQKAKVSISDEFMAGLSNQQNLPYKGRSYDKIMDHTYRAMNLLGEAQVDKARPEIIRAYQCQQDAVEENKRRIEKAQETEQGSGYQQQIQSAKSDPAFSQKLESVTKDFENVKVYADYVNPITVYLDGLYFLYAGVDGSDLERARKSLARTHDMAGDNKFVEADLQTVADGLSGLAAKPCTYILFETGEAASRDEARFDVPIILPNVPVSYVGAAFPKLAFHNNYAPTLTVKAGEVEEQTVLIADMDAIVALDFKNEWPVTLTKTLISAITKGVAAYKINESMPGQAAPAISPFIQWLTKTSTSVGQVAVNIADTRSWTTLPKQFQVARIDTPTDRKIVLSTPGSAPVEVALEDGTVNVVCAKSITPGSPLLVNQFKLK